MSTATEKPINFSIWDSVVNDRIIKFEDLEKRYRNKCREKNVLEEENGRLKECVEEFSAKLVSVNEELNRKEARIQELYRETVALRQWIENMENSTCWKLTKPLRLLIDRIRRS